MAEGAKEETKEVAEDAMEKGYESAAYAKGVVDEVK